MHRSLLLLVFVCFTASAALAQDPVKVDPQHYKVIFENDYLEDAHIVRLCGLCAEWNVAFVKTSTGYGFVKQPDGMYTYKGATDHHLRLMRRHCPARIAIKAAGGVRTLDDVLRVRRLGVSRIGATATESILAEARRRGFLP